jgi:quercetin dioxygenase-like cupin family protein
VTRVSAEGTVEGASGSQLELATVRLGSGASVPAGDALRDTILFGCSGEAVLAVGGAERTIAEGTAALVAAGTEATLRADSGAAVVRATVGTEGIDHHAPMGEAEPVCRLEAVEPGQATGSRSFQVLYGPHNGSVRATLFVGYIPPGKAPWHYHLYDEIVWILRGEGRLHLREGGTVEDLRPGCAFRLRPREVHIVENLSAGEELVVLGLFTPAGSPSAAYLEPGVLAEYRVG